MDQARVLGSPRRRARTVRLPRPHRWRTAPMSGQFCCLPRVLTAMLGLPTMRPMRSASSAAPSRRSSQRSMSARRTARRSSGSRALGPLADTRRGGHGRSRRCRAERASAAIRRCARQQGPSCPRTPSPDRARARGELSMRARARCVSAMAGSSRSSSRQARQRSSNATPDEISSSTSTRGGSPASRGCSPRIRCANAWSVPMAADVDLVERLATPRRDERVRRRMVGRPPGARGGCGRAARRPPSR